MCPDMQRCAQHAGACAGHMLEHVLVSCWSMCWFYAEACAGFMLEHVLGSCWSMRPMVVPRAPYLHNNILAPQDRAQCPQGAPLLSPEGGYYHNC